MSDRRNFLKILLAATAGLAAGSASSASAKSGALPRGLIYTKDNPGPWAALAGIHLPVVTVAGNKMTVQTNHVMTEKHYIVRHRLVTESGEVLEGKTFYPTAKKAVSVFDLPAGHHVIYAASFCNLHDFWVTEFKI